MAFWDERIERKKPVKAVEQKAFKKGQRVYFDRGNKLGTVSFVSKLGKNKNPEVFVDVPYSSNKNNFRWDKKSNAWSASKLKIIFSN